MLVIINKTMGEPLWGDILLWIENILYIFLNQILTIKSLNVYSVCVIYINIYTTYALKKGLQRMLIY